MHHKLLAPGLLALGCLQSAEAQEWPAAQCEGCSPQQMQAAARTEVDFGPVAVFSLSTADLKTYVINGNLELYESIPPAALDDYFADLIAVYQANGNPLRVHMDIADLAFIPASNVARTVGPTAQAEFPESAWEAINNPIPRSNGDFAGGGYREYEFNGPPAADLQNFLIEAQRRGIPVTGPIGTSFRISCASANGITTCQAR